MKTLLLRLRFAARIAFVIVAWAIVALVVVQVFFAGSAVLVNQGNWSSHQNLGHLIGVPIIILFVLSILGWMPLRFPLLGFALFVLYGLQYVFLYAPPPQLALIRAFHPVNALAIFTVAAFMARDSWRLVRS